MTTLAEFKSWAQNSSSIRRILVEINGVVNSVGQLLPIQFYLSNGAYSSTSTDTPANTVYSPIIKGGISFTENISLTGDVSVSYGDIELDNTEDSLGNVFGYIFDNRPITIYIGDPNRAKSDFKVLFRGTIFKIVSKDRNTVNIVISDKLQKLNNVISEATIVQPSKNNTKDLLPITFGECFSVTPLINRVTNTVGSATSITSNTITTNTSHGLSQGSPVVFSGTAFGGITLSVIYYVINPTSTTFQVSASPSSNVPITLTNATGTMTVTTINTYFYVHSGQIERIIEVRDNGLPVASYTPDLSAGRFTLNQAGYGQITCSVQGAKHGGTYTNKIAANILNILTLYGPATNRLTSADIDLANFSAFDQTINAPIGYFSSSSQNVLDVCNQLASSVRAKLTVNMGPLEDDSLVGKVKLTRLQFDTITSNTKVITSEDIEQFSLVMTDQPDIRAATKIAYCKNWTKQESGLATSLPPESVSLFNSEWLYVDSVNSTTRQIYELTSEPPAEETLLITNAAASTEASQRNNLFSTKRYVYNMTGYIHLFDIQLGETIVLNNRRYYLNNVPGIVISISRDWILGRVTIGVLV